MSPKILRNLLAGVVILVLGAVVAMVLVKTGSRPDRQAPPPSRPVVTVFPVAPDAEPVRVVGFGSVRAKRSVELFEGCLSSCPVLGAWKWLVA